MGANAKLAGAMATTTRTMGQMNRAVNPQQLAQTMRQFEQESAKMGMSEELGKSLCIVGRFEGEGLGQKEGS